MKIRPLRKAEISQASRIAKLNYSSGDAFNARNEMLSMFEAKVLVPRYLVAAEEDGRILGFGGYVQSWMDYHIYQIFWINVNPKDQRKGIGTAIVKKLISELKKKKGKYKKARMILLVAKDPSFYEKRFGFKILKKLDWYSGYLMFLNVK